MTPQLIQDEIEAAHPRQHFFNPNYRIPLLKQVSVNSFWLVLTRLITQAQLVVFTAVIARRLGEIGFGQYAFITSIVFLGNVVTTFGTDTYIIRELARSEDSKASLLTAALWIQILFSIAFIAIIIPTVAIYPNKTAQTVLGLQFYSLALIPLAFYTVYSSVLRAYQRMDLYLGANLVTILVQTVGAWFVVTGQGSLLRLIFLLFITQCISAIFAGILCKWQIPEFHLFLKLPWKSVRTVIKSVWPLALLSGLGVLYTRLGILTLSFLSGDAATGLFSASARVVEALKTVHIAVLGALLPALSQLGSLIIPDTESRTNESAANNLFRHSFFWLLLIAIGIAMAATFMARPIISILYGQAYLQGIFFLQILVWLLVPYSINASVTIRWITRNHEKQVAIVMTAGLLSALLLNVWLIPLFGLLGACLAALGAEFLQAILFLAWRKPW
ncbi:MAG: flippase [Anaerolineaceae bacterium]|nr:flippase [Anaerolineaceae bacterium]